MKNRKQSETKKIDRERKREKKRWGRGEET